MVLLEMKCNPIAFWVFYRKLKHVIVDDNTVIAFNELLSLSFSIYAPEKLRLIPLMTLIPKVTVLMQ